MLHPLISKSILNQEVLFLKDKAIVLPEKKYLILGDLHIGKATHFRKNGLPIANKHHDDILKLEKLIQNHRPEKIFYLGDLFHSDWNEEHDDFLAFVQKQNSIEHHLIQGNHDRLTLQLESLVVVTTDHNETGLHLIHEYIKKDQIDRDTLIVSGHVHPAVKLKGKGRQKMKFPAFVLRENHLLIPAFGSYCGTHQVKLKSSDAAIVVTEIGLMEV